MLKHRNSKYILAVLLLLVIVVPTLALAADVSFPFWPSDANPLLPCTGLNCVNFCQVLSLIQRLIYFGMTLGVEIIAPIFFIWGAFYILASAGSEERLSKGKKIFSSTVIGVLLTLGGFLMVNTLLWALGNSATPGQSAGVSWPNIECTLPPR